MGIEEWYAVVEPQEYDKYAAAIPKRNIIVLNMAYKEQYDYLDGLGLTKGSGSGPARNFIWDTAAQMGCDYHWIMDDNIVQFTRWNNNYRFEVLSGVFFRVMEDFVQRYENIGMAGPNYRAFLPRKYKRPPFLLNTRIYSCNLIRNDLPYRWRGRYNEDTILSLDMLRDGWCTCLFNAFQQDKMVTMAVKGGNTTSIYAEGTYPKSKLLVDEFPEYARLVEKYGRPHHFVDWTQFRSNRLKICEGIVIPEGTNDYGMELMNINGG